MNVMAAVFLEGNIDVFKWLNNIGYQILGLLTMVVLIVIGLRGVGLINKMAFPALISLVVAGIVLVMFTSGSSSKELIENLAESLLNYAKGG